MLSVCVRLPHSNFPNYADFLEIWYELHTAGGHPEAVLLISHHYARTCDAATLVAPLNLEP
jgi:hypothetical protein